MTQDKDLQRLSPDKLVAGFRRIDIFVIGLALAVGLHVLVIGGTSYSYVLDKLDPSRVEKREVEQRERKEADLAAKAAAEAAAEAKPAPNETEPAPEEKPVPEDDPTAGIPGDKRDHPVVRELTETADPEEIPEVPGTTGLGIDETNPEGAR